MEHYLCNRYQIIYPYLSDTIHTAHSITKGADKCYNELKIKDVKTHMFVIQDLDHGKLYYFNIPKYSDLPQTQNIMPETNISNANVNILNMSGMSDNPSSKNAPELQTRQIQVTESIKPVQSSQTIQSIQSIQSPIQSTQSTQLEQLTQSTQTESQVHNEIIKRLDNIESLLKNLSINK